MSIEAEEEPRTAWASHSQLPITIPPFAGETLRSYLARLTAANYLQETFLKAELKRHDFCHWLSLVTGRTEHQLISALPELRTAATLDAFPHLVGLASAKALVRDVCSQCVLTRARPKPYPRVFATHEHVICMKHLRWVGSNDALSCSSWEQFSVANCHQIVVANRRHRRLILRWGRQEVRGRFQDSLYALYYWRGQRDRVTSDPKVAACRAALGIEDDNRPYLPKDVASWYPNTVALTEVFVQQDADMKRVGVLDMDLVEAGIDAVSEKVLLGLKPSGARDPFLSSRRAQPFEWPAEVEIPGTR
jgi:hypothetical protein